MVPNAMIMFVIWPHTQTHTHTDITCSLSFDLISWASHTQTYALSHHPPPFDVPHPLSFPGGGGGGHHLVNPKYFVAAHCVVVWVTVLWGTATCIPCTHGRTFCSLLLK